MTTIQDRIIKPKSSEGKKDYNKQFENMLGNPIEQINGLITKAHTLSAKQKFINRFGEDPVDVLGQDWENYIEDYKEMVADEELLIDK
jgi:hypothetical protein